MKITFTWDIIEGKIDALATKVDEVIRLLTQEKQTMADVETLINKLEADVAAQTTVITSAVALINGFAAQLKAAAGDPVKIQGIIMAMETNSTVLATAVAANTPTATGPVPQQP